MMGMVLDRILDETLRFELQAGDVTPIGVECTGWRTVPAMVLACVRPGRPTLVFDGGRSCAVEAGCALVVPPGVLHRIDLHEEEAVSLWMHVNYFVLGHLDLTRFIEIPPVLGREPCKGIATLIAEWAEAREGWAAVNPVYRRARENELGFRILAILAAEARLRQDAGRQLERIRAIGAVIRHLDSHFADALDRDALAAMAHLSPAQFHRVFRRSTGVTPMRYLRELRVRRAQRALIDSDATVQEIAFQVGYDDPFVFSKVFKRVTGISPRVYRERLRASFG
jgi:AraC-like DNA-binding protein